MGLSEVRRLERLLAKGSSEQEIVSEMNLHPRTVRKKVRQHLLAQGEKQMFVRCPGCGAWVKLPCVLCRAQHGLR